MIKRFFLGILCLIVLCLFFYFFTEISENYFSKDNSKGELIKVFLTFTAGIIAILVWHSGYKRVKVMEEQTEKTTEQIQVMYKGNVDTRFNNAVGHLGNENPTVVLGGIHVLHQIAVDNKNYTQVVHNLFCSYLRENSGKLYEKIDFEKTPDKCPVIIQTLIDYLFRPYNNKDSVYENFKSDLSFSTLKNVVLGFVIMRNVNFSHCLLENCNFLFGTLNECDFRDGTLNKCDFRLLTLNKCNFKRHFRFDSSNKDAKLFDCRNIRAAILIDTELPPNDLPSKL